MSSPYAVGDPHPLWMLPTVKPTLDIRRARSFGAKRPAHKQGQCLRYHGGVDLGAPFWSPVVAPESGTVTQTQTFFGPEAYALFLTTDTGIVLLMGEVWPDSWDEFGVHKGSRVNKGDPIARVGRSPGGGTMLHFEAYTLGTRRTEQWCRDAPPPPNLLDPTLYAQLAATNQGQPLEDAPSVETMWEWIRDGWRDAWPWPQHTPAPSPEPEPVPVVPVPASSSTGGAALVIGALALAMVLGSE